MQSWPGGAGLGSYQTGILRVPLPPGSAPGPFIPSKDANRRTTGLDMGIICIDRRTTSETPRRNQLPKGYRNSGQPTNLIRTMAWEIRQHLQLQETATSAEQATISAISRAVPRRRRPRPVRHSPMKPRRPTGATRRGLDGMGLPTTGTRRTVGRAWEFH